MTLELKEVEKRYFKTPALAGASMRVARGQVVGLLGLNGAGKTTLLKVAAGLLLPDRGEVRLLGRPPRKARGEAVYLPEQNPWPARARPGEVARLLSGSDPRFDRKRFLELSAFLEVPKRTFAEMSRGQRARANLALALARRTPLYLLDEPLAGIDLISRDRILKAMVHEWREEAAVVLSTHEVGEAEGLFDRAVFLKAGRVVLDAEVEALRQEGKSVVETFKEVLA